MTAKVETINWNSETDLLRWIQIEAQTVTTYFYFKRLGKHRKLGERRERQEL